MGQHIFAITEDKLSKMNRLAERKLDREFVIITMADGWCDIAQWSDKYQNVKVLSLPVEKLDMTMRIG